MTDGVVVTRYGEVLTPHEDEDEHDADGPISTVVVHAVCNGFVDCEEVSATHKAFYCRSCGLRVVVPVVVRTWWQLRDYMRDTLPQASSASR